MPARPVPGSPGRILCLDNDKRSCVVDAATEVGGAIARIFTGFLTREFGEEAFKVERIAGAPPISPAMNATGAA